MHVIIVEDDDAKAGQLCAVVATVTSIVPDVVKSINSALRKLAEIEPHVMILDMSLPAFDYSTDEGGFRHIALGGRDVLDEVDRLGYHTLIIVVSAFDRFGETEGAWTIADLSADLEKQYPRNFCGSVWYSPVVDTWELSLTSLLRESTIRSEGL